MGFTSRHRVFLYLSKFASDEFEFSVHLKERIGIDLPKRLQLARGGSPLNFNLAKSSLTAKGSPYTGEPFNRKGGAFAPPLILNSELNPNSFCILHSLKILKLVLVKRFVHAVLRDQLFVRAALLHAVGGYNYNLVRVFYRGKAVGDDKRRSAVG